jgi:hypothetical protein
MPIVCIIDTESSRIASIEMTLHEMKSLLASSSTLQPISLLNKAISEAPSPLPTHSEESMQAEPEDTFARVAPLSVVRDLERIIIGTSPEQSPDESQADCISLGLVNENLCHSLFDGLVVPNALRCIYLISNRLASLPLQRYGLDQDPWEVRNSSPLLFGTFLLAGLYTIPTLCHSRFHVDLYDHVESLAAPALLRSPLPIESIQAFLMLAAWDLLPQSKDRYIDSWLMSGMGIMHGILSVDLEKHAENPDDTQRRSRATWNALCVTHLQCVLLSPVTAQQKLSVAGSLLERAVLPFLASGDFMNT